MFKTGLEKIPLSSVPVIFRVKSLLEESLFTCITIPGSFSYTFKNVQGEVTNI